MKVFGISGHSGMGKTTLLERLIPELAGRGLRVSVIKESGKDIEVDRPGKDSFRLRHAGGTEVLLVGTRRWALMHELAPAEEPALDDLLRRLQPCDLVLVEGFKQCCFPKLEVWRAEEGKEPLWPGLDIVAVAAPPVDGRALRASRGDVPMLALRDTAGIADYVLLRAEALDATMQPGSGRPSSPARSPWPLRVQ